MFHGFVRVLMNLNRPVNVHSDTSDLSMKRALRRSNSKRVSKRHQSVAVTNRGPAGNRGASLRDRSASFNATLPAPVTSSSDEQNSSPNDSPRSLDKVCLFISNLRSDMDTLRKTVN